MKKILITIILLSLSIFALFSQTRIKMQKEGSIYTIPCKVNGLNLRFIFDTGASDVSISISEAVFMLKNGYLDSDDIFDTSRSIIADGSIVENTRIILRKIEIGGLILNNVEATVVHSMEAPLLLGQSAIQKLGKIQLESNELVIINSEDLSSGNNQAKANKLLSQAWDYWRKELFLNSYEKFTQAYNIYPQVFNFKDYINYAWMCYYTKNDEMALVLLNKANSIKEVPNEIDWERTSSMLELFSHIYYMSEQYTKAILYIEEAINLNKKYIDKNKRWKDLADLHICKADIYFYGKRNNYMAEYSYKDALDLWEAYQFKNSYGSDVNKFIKNLDKGLIKNEWLGNLFYKYGLCNEDYEKSNSSIKIAAKLGNQQAKEFLNRLR